jgi:hypothetical protein
MKHELRSISAFWRNEQDGGLGLSFRPKDDDDEGLAALDDIAKALEELVAEFQKAEPIAPFTTMHDERISFLKACAAEKGTLSLDNQILAMASIRWLEQTGRSKADNTNGMLYEKILLPCARRSRPAERR